MDFPADVFILNSVKDLGNVIYTPLKNSEIPPAPLETREHEWQLSRVGTLFPEGYTASPKFLRRSSCIYIVCYGI